jgi:predicted ATP-binding protein involved in virulence
MRITKLHLKNIGVFEDEIIEFKEKTNPEKAEIHILTGENGTGKSTILYALANIYLDVNYLLFQKRIKKTNENGLIVWFDNDTDTNFWWRFPNQQQEKISDIIKSYYSKTRNIYINKFEFAFFAYSGYRNVGAYKIESITEIYQNPFENSLDFDKSIDPLLLINWIANKKTKEALALAKGEIEKAEKHRRSINRIEQAVSNITGWQIEFELEDDPLNVVLKVNGQKLEFDALPDGLKSIVSWIADLLMRMDRIKWATDEDILDRNFILFLDEIEVHLHPAWQRKILPEVQKLFKNAQIFISTHSPFVVGSVEDAWVYKLKLEKGNSKVVEVVESKAGESINLILDEIFDVEEEFDEATERDFTEFYQLRDELLNGNWDLEEELNRKAEYLAQKSNEIKDIVGQELRQIHKLKTQKSTLAK